MSDRSPSPLPSLPTGLYLPNQHPPLTAHYAPHTAGTNTQKYQQKSLQISWSEGCIFNLETEFVVIIYGDLTVNVWSLGSATMRARDMVARVSTCCNRPGINSSHLTIITAGLPCTREVETFIFNLFNRPHQSFMIIRESVIY